MQVEFTSLKRNYEMFREEYDHAVLDMLAAGWYILGPQSEGFEKEFAEHMNVRNCIGVNSGTDALILAVRALGIGPGDEVIVPAGTYIASVIGITENGAVPVFVDSDKYMTMDADRVEELITDRTKAILVVHLYGQPCDMGKICDIADRYGLDIIEDCAQCHDSKFNGKKTGTFGTIGCFSFYPTKPLGAMGDAGAMITDDDELADRIRMLRNYGSKVKYVNEINGINSRMDDIQASILRVGLKHIGDTGRIRLEIADRYRSEIHNDAVKLPEVRPGTSHVFHLFPVMVEDQKDFQKYLADNGIKTQIHYPIPPYIAECYENFGHKPEEYPEAYRISKHEVSLPIYAGMPEAEVKYVIDTVNSYRK